MGWDIMRINGITDEVEMKLSREELLVLNTAFNEICNGIDIFEFETRIGAPRATVECLMAEIQVALDQLERR